MSIVYVRFPPEGQGGDGHEGDRWQGRQRAPLLERLLARADGQAVVTDWRVDASRCVTGAADAPPAPGAAALYAQAGRVAAPWVCMATPVSYVAAMTTVRLPPDGCLRLSGVDARRLAADFNRVFVAGGQRLFAADDGSLCCSFDARLTVETRDPVTVQGGEIGSSLPAGPDGARLRGLMSEIEMWLYEHALNAQRTARGELPISALWLWGGGETLAELAPLPAWLAGRDPLFSAWSTRRVSAPEPGSGIVLLETAPGGEGWAAAEALWLAPALDALAEGRIASLELSAGARRYSLGARWRWRWWRRSRPWWESLA